MTVLKAPATRQDIELRIGRDHFISIPIKNPDGTPYAFLADKLIVWRMGINKPTPLLTHRSDDGTNPIQIIADEFRVLVPVLKADTTIPARMLVSSPSTVYYHELEVIDTSGKGVNVTEGKVFVFETFE